MVKLTLEQIKNNLGTNALREGFHTFFLNSMSTRVMVSFKEQSAELERRLIMHRLINGEQKVRMILEEGDRIQLIEDSSVNGKTQALPSFVNITEYVYSGRRFNETETSKEELRWQPINFTNPQGYCSQVYLDVQRAIFNDALLNFVEINNIGFPRISFETNERYKSKSGLAFGLIFKPKGYDVIPLTPRDDIEQYDAIAHVRLSGVAAVSVQTHTVKQTVKTHNLIRKKLLDSNCMIADSEGNLLMVIYGDVSKLDIEIVE